MIKIYVMPRGLYFMSIINNDIENENESDLFDFLKYILSCTYISDLKFDPYKNKVKLILKQLNLKKYSSKQVDDMFEYIYKD